MNQNQPDFGRSAETGEKLIEGVLEDVKSFYEENGFIDPFALILSNKTAEGEPGPSANIIHVPNGFNNAEDKNKFALSLREYLKQVDAFCVCFICDAWQLCLDVDDPTPLDLTQPLQNHPDRKEVVMVSFEHAVLGERTYVTSIKRSKAGGKISCKLETFERQEAKGTGRFKGLLPQHEQSEN